MLYGASQQSSYMYLYIQIHMENLAAMKHNNKNVLLISSHSFFDLSIIALCFIQGRSYSALLFLPTSVPIPILGRNKMDDSSTEWVKLRRPDIDLLFLPVSQRRLD